MLSYIKSELRPLKKHKLFLALVIVCILRKTLFNRARDMDAYSSVDANASVAILMTMILGALMLTKMGKIKQEIKRCSPFLFYYYFAAISVLWAGMQSLAIAGYKAVEVIVGFFFSYVYNALSKNNKGAFYFYLGQPYILQCDISHHVFKIRFGA